MTLESYPFLIRSSQMEKTFKKVELKVNGKDISLNAFSNNIIGGAIWGMVCPLKLEEEPKEIEIKISA